MRSEKELTVQEEDELIYKILRRFKIRINPYTDMVILTTFFRGRFFALKFDVKDNIVESHSLIDYLELMLEYITVHKGIPIVKGKGYDFGYIKGFKKENDDR